MHRADDNFDRFARHQWRRFEAMARRGWGGFGGRGGPGAGPGAGRSGDWGQSFRIGRMLASGDLRLVALYFIEQQPRHGYDLIKAIEDKTGGIYVPSPGIVYPALTFLEEAGYVTSAADGNKRLYTITAEGTAHLGENRSAVETTLDYLARIGEQAQRLREHWAEAERKFHDYASQPPDRDIDDVDAAVNEARRELKDAIRQASRGDADTQRHLAEILRRAADDIRKAAHSHRDPDQDIDI